MSIWATTRQNQQNECAPIEDSDQPRHPPSLIRVFAVSSMGSSGPKLSSCGKRRLWSDCAGAQADLSLRWAHTHFVGFVAVQMLTYCWKPVVSSDNNCRLADTNLSRNTADSKLRRNWESPPVSHWDHRRSTLPVRFQELPVSPVLH